MTKASVARHVALVVLTWAGVSMCVADVHPERAYTPGGPGFVGAAPRSVRRDAAKGPAGPPRPSAIESTVASALTQSE
jgi:hypothetical protein